MLYRYEVYADGEYLGVGILQELDDMFSTDRAKDLAWPFDQKLQIPPRHIFKEQTVSFFTEKGQRVFKKDLKAIKAAYEEETCFDVKTLIINEKDIHQDDILWSDEYQVILRKSAIIR